MISHLVNVAVGGDQNGDKISDRELVGVLASACQRSLRKAAHAWAEVFKGLYFGSRDYPHYEWTFACVGDQKLQQWACPDRVEGDDTGVLGVSVRPGQAVSPIIAARIKWKDGFPSKEISGLVDLEQFLSFPFEEPRMTISEAVVWGSVGSKLVQVSSMVNGGLEGHCLALANCHAGLDTSLVGQSMDLGRKGLVAAAALLSRWRSTEAASFNFFWCSGLEQRSYWRSDFTGDSIEEYLYGIACGFV
ncbi:hypothetical protein NE237_015206 [Protea cynaroides]|uniref:Uncharacterized protein n=1 Tax=Protea cynaroides TaxID=273540 RepID=A0A9Q0QQU6_9MAGN|nr:hypothetical protein NE237_015206 [Protea cynaroides]